MERVLTNDTLSRVRNTLEITSWKVLTTQCGKYPPSQLKSIVKAYSTTRNKLEGAWADLGMTNPNVEVIGEAFLTICTAAPPPQIIFAAVSKLRDALQADYIGCSS